jgi:ketosteroid isomerase-like protein
MNQNVETIRGFYAALAAGDADTALGLMSHDIEWLTMWHYKVNGRGPQKVAEGLLVPLMKEWSSHSLVSTEFIAEGDTVVSLGHFTGVHAETGKTAEADYAHVWTIKVGRITKFRQYIDTLAVAQART